MSELDKIEKLPEKKGIKELKEVLLHLLDAVELLAEDYKDGAEIIDEIKDIDMAEGVELAMLVLMRIPKLLEAFKKK